MGVVILLIFLICFEWFLGRVKAFNKILNSQVTEDFVKEGKIVCFYYSKNSAGDWNVSIKFDDGEIISAVVSGDMKKELRRIENKTYVIKFSQGEYEEDLYIVSVSISPLKKN